MLRRTLAALLRKPGR